MAWRTLVAILVCACCVEQAEAQRFRRFGRRSGGGPPRDFAPTIDLPRPFVPQFGGQFAPVQYFTPPIIRGADGRLYYPQIDPRLTGYRYGYQQNQVIAGQLRATPNQSQRQAGQGVRVAKPTKVQEIEPPPVNVQQAAAGDQVAAIRFQGAGDTYFRTGNYNRAFGSYQSAISADATRAEPYFRMAFLFATIGRHDASVRYLKQGLDLAPEYPREGDGLGEMFGPNLAGKQGQVVAAVLASANRNSNSPDHQLMAGAVLFFNGNKRESAAYLERAANKSQRPARATALLSARGGSGVVPASGELKLAPEPEMGTLPSPTLKVVPPAKNELKVGPAAKTLELPPDPAPADISVPKLPELRLPKLPPPPPGKSK